MDEFIVLRDTDALNTGDSVIILRGPVGVDCREEFEGQVGVVEGSGGGFVRVSACRKGANSPEDWVYLRKDLAKKLQVCEQGDDKEISGFIDSF